MTFEGAAALRERPRPVVPPAGATEPDHERVLIRQDPGSGLRMIVAVHSTVLGPALGGMRLKAYPGGFGEALADALALARTMTLKASAAGLDLGGGKAVVIDDGAMARSEVRERRLEAAGAVVEELGGAYVTAEDIGTSTADMDVVARRTTHVVGRSRESGGAGDPSPVTAEGVERAIRRALAEATGSPELESRSAGVIGLGKVGGRLARSLAAHGAAVSAFDIDAERLEAAAAHGVRPARSAEELMRAPLDVLCPCAAGGMIDERTAGAIEASVVCGAANNPLSGPAAAEQLARRDVLSVPDFLANCGGLIHVAADLRGYDRRLVDAGLERAMERLDAALAAARDGSVTPAAAAERQALERVERARARRGG